MPDAPKASGTPVTPETPEERLAAERAQAETAAAEEKAKAEARIAREEKAGYTSHAKGLGLHSGKRYLVATSNPNQNVTGKLIRTSDLGVVLKSDGGDAEHSSFFPWHNVVALHKSAEPEGDGDDE